MNCFTDRDSVRLSTLGLCQRAGTWTLALALALGAAACGDDTTVSGESKQDTAGSGADVDISVGGQDAQDTQSPPDIQVLPDVQADTGADVQSDVAADVQADTAEVTKPTCPGGPGCDCADDTKCDAGKCLDTPAGKQCAKACTVVGDCANGYSCKQIGSGTDASSYCVPSHLSICAPCSTNKDCQVQGIDDALCIDYGNLGKFCGGACKDDASCPTGYACTEVKDAGAGTVKQCKLKDITKAGSGKDCSTDPKACASGETCVAGTCQLVTPGVCECSAWAKTKGTVTTCTITNDQGSCSAERKCTDAGLAPCTAKTPKAEICNAEDDNCDAKVDNLAADFTCYKKGFLEAGSLTVCKLDSDCTAAGEACDEAAGKCKTLVGKCKGKPQCGSNGELICADAQIPTAEICDGKDNNCDGSIDEGFTWKSPYDGADMKVGAACGVGPCANGTVMCKDNLTAVCTTYSTAGKETCDSVDNDCNGKTDDLACDDGNACTADSCDGGTKKCTNAVNSCDDKDQCTEDKCDAKTGDCSHPKYSGSCSDGDPCTIGDTCGDSAGAWTCLAGATKDKCDDNNSCTDDSCQAGKGCVNAPNAQALPCYTGKAGTQDIGTCKGGTYACVNGLVDKTKCVQEVTPNATELCDGKDDTCDGKTDEGCKPTSVAVTFSSAYVAGNTGADKKLQLIVGPSGPVGAATGTGKYNINFGFLSWLMQLIGK